jgi:uncharacterized protein YbjT (DUF2867 family)
MISGEIVKQGGTMNERTTQDETILVVGGTGKTGSRVATLLRGRGIEVRIGSRTGETAFDWETRSTWGPALAGASAAYVAYYPDLAVPGAAEAVGALAEQAAAMGVGRLVLLSGRGEPEAERAEVAVREAMPARTVVRASWFNQNFSENYMVDPIREGELVLPAGAVREPFVDADDIAEVAVEALTEDGHEGRVYEVTGPRLLTFADAVAEIGSATGRELHYVPVPVDAYTEALAAENVPDDAIGLLGYLFTEVLDGRNAKLAGGVQQALGREPRDFADYARRTAATGVWNP